MISSLNSDSLFSINSLCLLALQCSINVAFLYSYGIKGLEYYSGSGQFEGYGFVPNGTSGTTIAQIHGAAMGATTIIIRIYNGNMKYYTGDLEAENLYHKWFRLNIIHDVDGGMVSVFIDGEMKFQVKDRGQGEPIYFKCGVYAAPANISYNMESRWRDIKIYKK